MSDRPTPQPGPPPSIEIVAVPPRPESTWLRRIGPVAWVLDLLSGGGAAVELPGGGSRQTRVVVRYRGREHLLFEESSFEVAQTKCERIAREYEAIAPDDWYARDRVPEDFFTG